MPTSPTTVSATDRVLAVLADGQERTAAQVADAGHLGRSTATRILAALAAGDAVRRTPGGRRGGQRLPDRYTLPAANRPSDAGGQRLGRGELTGLVLAYLNAHPDDHSPVEVARGLGGRSSGAVSNALETLTTRGHATRTCEKPRRYQGAS